MSNWLFKVFVVRAVVKGHDPCTHTFGESVEWCIHSDKEIAVIRMLSDNVKYEILKFRAVTYGKQSQKREMLSNKVLSLLMAAQKTALN